MKEDNFVEAYVRIHRAFVMLAGGYYEPKSDRDMQASYEVCALLNNLAQDLTIEEKSTLKETYGICPE